jgi:hypothetical protein
MLLRTGRFELDLQGHPQYRWRFGSLYVRIGRFERFWNAYGLPS